jgi:hypothetical protein
LRFYNYFTEKSQKHRELREKQDELVVALK